jgi:hypothetical protein
VATHLDAEMLILRTPIAPIGTPDAALPLVTNLPDQLGGRLLLRYLTADRLGTLLNGTPTRQYVAPTAYAPGETVSWLGLPPSVGPRTHALLLKPDFLQDAYGPRWVQFGGGIEYILEGGFRADAIADIAPGPVGASRWELELR